MEVNEYVRKFVVNDDSKQLFIGAFKIKYSDLPHVITQLHIGTSLEDARERLNSKIQRTAQNSERPYTVEILSGEDVTDVVYDTPVWIHS